MPGESSLPPNNPGDGYEFSFRINGGQRLFMHVTKKAIDQLPGSSLEQESQLSLIVRNMPALRAATLKRHVEEGISRVVLTAADVAGL